MSDPTAWLVALLDRVVGNTEGLVAQGPPRIVFQSGTFWVVLPCEKEVTKALDDLIALRSARLVEWKAKKRRQAEAAKRRHPKSPT